MTNITPTEEPDISKRSKTSKTQRFKLFPYLVAGILGNGAIVGLAFLVITFVPPSYTSEWAIIVSGEQTQFDVDLKEGGDVSSNTAVVESSRNNDPREIYQYLANDESVWSMAAEAVGVEDWEEEVGEATIELVENTTIMELSVNGDSPEEAQKRATAIYEAMVLKIESLREEAYKQQIDEKQISLVEKLEKKRGEAQAKIELYYRLISNINVPETINHNSQNLENLRQNYAQVIADQQDISTQFQVLSDRLGISPQQANDAFLLQADQVLQEHLNQYSLSSANLEILLATWHSKSPAVILEQEKQDLALAAMLQRASIILGKPVDESILQLLKLNSNSSGTSSREALLSELISLHKEKQGLEVKARTLVWQITQLEERLRALAQQQVELDRLEKNLEFAEVQFNSAKAELDLSESYTSATYPEVTWVRQPNLPEDPSFPDLKIVVLGTVAGCFLFTSGLLLLWWDKRQGGMLKLFTEEDFNYYSSEVTYAQNKPPKQSETETETEIEP